MTATSTFAIASRDELWLRGKLMESRLMHGEARQQGPLIEATDSRDERLVRACDDALGETHSVIAVLRDARVRVVVRATIENGVESIETTMTISIGGLSVVTTPANAHIDADLLHLLADATPAMTISPLPIVWQNGSAAVLLHEAVGHANEHDSAAVSWPAWLSVEAPLVSRRETFRDAPLPRMKHVLARQQGAPFALPDRHIEVHLIAGGAYDPVTDIVTIDIAVSTAGSFTIRRTRSEIAAALVGAAGEPIRYPGVICSREGQELYVGSHAPVMITDALT